MIAHTQKNGCYFYSPAKEGSKALIGLQAPQIWCPGARISGFSTSAGFLALSMIFGPLEENLLTIGAWPLKEAALPSPIDALAASLVGNPLASLNVCCS